MPRVRLTGILRLIVLERIIVDHYILKVEFKATVLMAN